MTDRRKVILVEPDADDASPLAHALGLDGWEVTRASDVATAFQEARQTKPAALVMRGLIPGGGAIALLQRLRRSAHTALVPVVAVLPAGRGDREELQRWGVQAFLDAPASDEAVRAAVRKHAAEPLTIKQAPAPALNAPARLEALEKTGLLDTPPEVLFDRMAHLAAHLLDVPVVLMSLVDRQRQFFKSQVGLPEPVASARETPLSHSFCQWVVSDQGELVVPDARQHPLLRSNGSTTDMGVMAYAGVPLRGDSTETIGSFCAIDMRPRLWEEQELLALRDAAAVIEGLTVLRQSAHRGPLALDDFRAATAVVGRAMHSAARLLASGAARMTAEEHRDLVLLTGDLGRQLAELSGPASASSGAG